MTVLPVIVLIAFGCCNLSLASRIAKCFVKNEIVPDIIDKPPYTGITIVYPSGAVVNCGNELTPTQVKDKPRVKWDADSSKLYTLLMADPDAESRANATERSIKHWLVFNIPGSAVHKGDEAAGYLSAAPGKGSGLHRYTFLVYEQPYGRINYRGAYIPSNTIAGRENTDVRQFMRNYTLCDPSSGNMFQAQYDNYVPIVEAELGLPIQA